MIRTHTTSHARDSVARPDTGRRRVVGRRTRLTRWAAATACAAIVLAGCGTVPGAAVQVNGSSVSTSDLLSRVSSILKVQATDEQQADDQIHSQVARSQITDIIRHDLVKKAAKKHHIDVDQQDINKFIEQYDSSQTAQQGISLAAVMHVPASDVRTAAYDFLVLQQLIQNLPQQGVDVTNVTVTVDAVPAKDWSTAVADRVKYTDDPGAMTRDAKAARAKNPQLPGGEESLVYSPNHAVFGIFSAPEGKILLIPQGSDGYLVTRITKRKQAPMKVTAAIFSHVYQSMGLDAEIALSSLLLSSYANDLHVNVNPRFGQWDPRIVQVVASGVPQ